MHILSEHDTIKYLLQHKCSIARYGDGEIKLCFGRNAMSQVACSEIGKDLRRILKSKDDRCLVGIPRILERRKWSTADKKKFWMKYTSPKVMSLYNPTKLYGSAFITRPDASPEIDNKEYFDLVKQLWIGKRVILIQGEYQRFNKSKTLLGCANQVHVVCEPKRDAYFHLKDIIPYIKDNTDENTVVIVSLGPAATVLCFELAKLNIQALDLGHMGQFYSNCHPKSRNYTGEPFELN